MGAWGTLLSYSHIYPRHPYPHAVLIDQGTFIPVYSRLKKTVGPTGKKTKNRKRRPIIGIADFEVQALSTHQINRQRQRLNKISSSIIHKSTIHQRQLAVALAGHPTVGGAKRCQRSGRVSYIYLVVWCQEYAYKIVDRDYKGKCILQNWWRVYKIGKNKKAIICLKLWRRLTVNIGTFPFTVQGDRLLVRINNRREKLGRVLYLRIYQAFLIRLKHPSVKI